MVRRDHNRGQNLFSFLFRVVSAIFVHASNIGEKTKRTLLSLVKTRLVSPPQMLRDGPYIFFFWGGGGGGGAVG